MKKLGLFLAVVFFAIGCKTLTHNESEIADVVDSSGNDVRPSGSTSLAIAHPILKSEDCADNYYLGQFLDSEKSFVVAGQSQRGVEELYFINGQCSKYLTLKSNEERLSYIKDRIAFTFMFYSDFVTADTSSGVAGNFLVHNGYIISQDSSTRADYMCLGENTQYCDVVVENRKLAKPFIRFKKKVTPRQFLENKAAGVQSR